VQYVGVMVGGADGSLRGTRASGTLRAAMELKRGVKIEGGADTCKDHGMCQYCRLRLGWLRGSIDIALFVQF
jgi:hypothetical protein